MARTAAQLIGTGGLSIVRSGSQAHKEELADAIAAVVKGGPAGDPQVVVDLKSAGCATEGCHRSLFVKRPSKPNLTPGGQHQSGIQKFTVYKFCKKCPGNTTGVKNPSSLVSFRPGEGGASGRWAVEG